MKFKKIVIATILAVSQVAMVLPASAEEVNPKNENVVQETLQDTLQDTVQDTEQEDVVQTEDPAQVKAPSNTENTSIPNTTPPTSNGDNQLVLLMNSNKMYLNGKEYLAGSPMEVKKGVSYISIRAIVERAGFQLTFDNSTKETIIQRGTDELRFKNETSSYKVNGVTKTMKGSSYVLNGNFMVPLTAITNALNITYYVDQPNKRVIVNLSTNPIASFTIGNEEIIAGETTVIYNTTSSSPSGLQIVNEEWIGRQEIYSTPGNYTVTYRVQDSSGQWSDAYSLTLTVIKPHTPPVANFATDRDTYKMGELVIYSDYSTDEVGITDRKWENRQLAFFTPGKTSIRLTVTNKFGLTSTFEKTITITDETLYARDDFFKIFTPVGEKISFNGSVVPSWEKLNYSFYSEPTTLIRSNSPETVYSEGIVYEETASGNTRFMIHHVNATGKNVKMYVIATNNNEETTRLTQTNLGFGGPSQFATAAGKLSVDRYYASMQSNEKYKDIWIAPGDSKLILTELNAIPMKKNEVISLFADLNSDRTLSYKVIMIDADKDPFETVSSLGYPVEDVHNRGTYFDATRNIVYNDLVGTTPIRLMIGDNSKDPYLVGYDGITKNYKLNAGNFGVLYKAKLYRVAPNTLITFNPRGGRYYGSILVNGEIVQLSNSSRSISAPNEQAVLYRTGDREEVVEFVFTAAPGSNLSVNLLLQPMPEKKN